LSTLAENNKEKDTDYNIFLQVSVRLDAFEINISAKTGTRKSVVPVTIMKETFVYLPWGYIINMVVTILIE
jgi:hypothetical protein